MEAIKATQAVKNILTERDMQISALARIIGLSTGAAWERLTQENISVKKLSEMLDVLDYAVVIQPKGKKLVEGAVVIK